jgi:hypothetical protein
VIGPAIQRDAGELDTRNERRSSMSRATGFVHRAPFAETEANPSRSGDTRGAVKRNVWRDSRPIPQHGFEHHLHEVHGGKCPLCKRAGPVDVHRSHLAWSILLVPLWSSLTQVCCRSCGIKIRLGGIAFSALFGLWGIPFCWIIPPLLHSRFVGFVSIELRGLSFGASITPLGLIRSLNRINFGVQRRFPWRGNRLTF